MTHEPQSPRPGILEALGLSLLPELFGRRVFPDWPPKSTRTCTETLQSLCAGGPVSPGDAGYIEERCKSLYETTNLRIDAIQQKASNLIGITGISVTLTSGLGGLLLAQSPSLRPPLPAVLAGLFALTAFSFLFAVFLALRVIAVGHHNYEFMEPSAEDIFKIPSADLSLARIEHGASLLASHLNNSRVADRKASYLIGAQLWFRNAVMLTVLVSISIACASVLPRSTGSSIPTGTPTPAQASAATASRLEQESPDPASPEPPTLVPGAKAGRTPASRPCMTPEGTRSPAPPGG